MGLNPVELNSMLTLQRLYKLGFNPTRFDPDVWYKLREDSKGYDYISTYVDDFLITAKDHGFT